MSTSYVYKVGDFNFGQLLVIPYVIRTPRMTGLGEWDTGRLHPEYEEVTEIRLRLAGFREGDCVGNRHSILNK